MDRLKSMKEQMVSVVQSQMGNLECVDAKELGEAVDMIKDLAEAIYYCSITDAMEDSEKQPKTNNYYYTQPMDQQYDYNMGRMYYSSGNGGGGSNGSGSGNSNGGNSNYYTPRSPYYMEQPMMGNQRYPMHDYREGRSYSSRRGYMESKEMHKDSATQMRELEKYIKDLSQDLTEMIEQATPEEKQVLQQKIATLATKIQ